MPKENCLNNRGVLFGSANEGANEGDWEEI